MKNLIIALLFPVAICAHSAAMDPFIAHQNQNAHATMQIQPNHTACAMAAADVRMFAEDYKNGVSISTELKRYGNYDFRRNLIQQVYRMSANLKTTPDELQTAAYEQCLASM